MTHNELLKAVLKYIDATPKYKSTFDYILNNKAPYTSFALVKSIATIGKGSWGEACGGDKEMLILAVLGANSLYASARWEDLGYFGKDDMVVNTKRLDALVQYILSILLFPLFLSALAKKFRQACMDKGYLIEVHANPNGSSLTLGKVHNLENVDELAFNIGSYTTGPYEYWENGTYTFENIPEHTMLCELRYTKVATGLYIKTKEAFAMTLNDINTVDKLFKKFEVKE